MSKGNETKWNFPNCVGSIDGKHIQLQAPIGTGSDYYNYKSTSSIVLMAVVDADYNFIYADIGCQGRISEGGVFRTTSFFKKTRIKYTTESITQNFKWPGKKVPYVFVADEAFPLTNNIMKPYSGSQGFD